MPRPPLKRRKSNSKSPRGRVKKFNDEAQRQQLDKKLANKPVGQRPADSDDSDRLVTQTPNATGRKSLLRKEIYASGAVAKGDRPGGYPTRAERRRNLQNDTQQIIKKNRAQSQSSQLTHSRSTSPTHKSSADQEAPTTKSKQNVLPSAAQAVVPWTVIKSARGDNKGRVQHTPLGETSILGTLKPRKRQASILHLIDNQDSSLVDPEDEERFLPDDESTPLNVRLNQGRATNLVNELSATSSRKRKFGAEYPSPSSTQSPRNHISTHDRSRNPQDSNSPHSSKIVALPLSLSPPNQAHVDYNDYDIMAPPQSSSSEPSPRKSYEVQTHTAKPPPPLSTEQLKSLMPSKRRKGTRNRKVIDAFDIPEDSSSDPIIEEDESVFLPKKKAASNRTKAASIKALGAHKSSAPTRNKKAKSTDPTTSSSLKSLVRTPLPLNRSINAENRKLRSPSVQLSLKPASEGPDSKPSGKQRDTDFKLSRLSGGSHQTGSRRTRSAKIFLADSIFGQENADKRNEYSSPHSEDFENARSDTQAGQVIETPVDLEPEIEVARGHRVQADTDLDLTRVDGNEAKQWNNKWADIDQWSLAYEDVEISTGSSPPFIQ